VLGGGSNVVVSDQGIDALVVTPGAAGYAFTSDGPGAVVRADAGVNWDALVAASVERGLSGLEALSGIPGQVGGAPVQNIGAYGRELSEVLLEVTVWDRRQRLLRTLSHDECAFGYRTSRFKRHDAGRFVILDVALRLSRKRPELGYADLTQRLETLHEDTEVAVRQIRDAVLAIRRQKGMVLQDPRDPNHRSVGSFFTNPVVSEQVADDVQRRAGATARPMPRFPAAGGGVKLSAAWLIENAGFEKGWGDGAVGLSTQHALAIVNRRGATAVDVIRLARRVRGAVKRLFGVVLEPEPTFLGFDVPIDQLLA
jgi:UDP-N-acetylmuramate dehydrogenase